MVICFRNKYFNFWNLHVAGCFGETRFFVDVWRSSLLDIKNCVDCFMSLTLKLTVHHASKHSAQFLIAEGLTHNFIGPIAMWAVLFYGSEMSPEATRIV